MKIKKEFIKDTSKLIEMGFGYEKVKTWDEECYETKGKLLYNLGHSRRGQFYYLIIEDDRSISVFATKPDGDGTSVGLEDILLELFKNNMIE